MMPVSRLLVPAALAAVLWTTAAVAHAQTPQMPASSPTQEPITSGRPFRGTFGGGADNREQTLTFTGSLGAGFESEYLIAPADGSEVTDQGGGGFGAGSANIAYALNRERASMNASVGATTFYYDRSDMSWVHAFNVNASQSLQIALTAKGHTVKAVQDGPSALRVLEAFAPDVILLDIGLPEIDGYEVARRIRATPAGRSVTLLAITGWGQEQDRRRARESGFDRHLTKPVEGTALEALIAAGAGPMPSDNRSSLSVSSS